MGRSRWTELAVAARIAKHTSSNAVIVCVLLFPIVRLRSCHPAIRRCCSGECAVLPAACFLRAAAVLCLYCLCLPCVPSLAAPSLCRSTQRGDHCALCAAREAACTARHTATHGAMETTSNETRHADADATTGRTTRVTTVTRALCVLAACNCAASHNTHSASAVHLWLHSAL